MRPACLLLPFLLVACGGSWSNRDLEFASVVPDREVLRSKLAGAPTSTPPPDGGVEVGNPSQASVDAFAAQTRFNGILDYFLGVLDTVRMPPTSRTASSRTWGPFPDATNAGYQFALTVTQGAATAFTWALVAQPIAGGPDLVIVDGAFTAASVAREGQGAMVVHVKDFKGKLLVDADFAALDRIDLAYRTDVLPRQVSMHFTFQPGASSNLSASYGYLERADQSGAMSFQARTTSLEATEFSTLAQWTTQGDGRSVAQVTQGTYQGTTIEECWDAQRRVSYHFESWPGGRRAGADSACPTFSDPP
jgi:hypothetical protein